MNKKESIISGKKAYIAPVSYCLTVNSSIICASGGNSGIPAEFGGELGDPDPNQPTNPTGGTTFSGGAGSLNP